MKITYLYHIYLTYSKGKALLRVATYYSMHKIWGQKPAAFEDRSTARFWANHITKDSGQPFRVLQCRISDCPVCKKARELTNGNDKTLPELQAEPHPAHAR